MRCAACSHDNREEARFCLECGQPFGLRCSRCGAELPAAAKFCDRCAAPVAEPSAEVASPATTPASPSSFVSGRYQVRRFLGEGAKKRVYLARDTRLDRDVAIGVIKREGLNAEGRDRMRREAQAMGRLGDHPNLVTVYDVVEEGDDLYIVSQYMAGGDLESHLAAEKNHQLSIDETLRIAGEICQALAHAHSLGVIHRDLKPGNVWLTEDGAARLGDFGLALSLERSRLTQEGMMVGTAAYMPPEQALSGEVTARSDLYALGAVLYEMVTGRPPFLADDLVAVISQHINTPPVAPSWHNAEVPPPLEALILRLLAKDPGVRPEDASAVRRMLASISTVSAKAVPEGEGLEANPLDGLSGGVFVGREQELERARGPMDEALSGEGRILMLVGEPGIGKTRMAEELSTYARLRGAQVLWGRCYEGEGAPSYWPWVQIIRSYLHDQDPATLLSEMGAGASAVADIVSEVRERIPGLQPAPPLEPEQARFRLFDSVTSFLSNASRRRPIVLVLDDLHWADKPSLLLLQFLSAELAGSRILALGTYRDVELRRTHPLAETLAELSRSGEIRRVLLRGLRRADVGRFIELSADRKPPPGLVEAVYQETEGNPFFVHEVVRLLTSEGQLERPEKVQSWSLTIPQGIREVVGRRLNSLSEECNRFLAISSVIGREFDFAVLQRVSDVARDRLFEALEEAIAARVVEETAEAIDRYRFAHALVREILYEELGTTHRIRLHRRIGEVLEEHYATQAERHLSELAYHAVEGAHGGGDVEKAIDYATRAGDRATALYAYEDAIPQYQRALQALELLEARDDLRRCDLLINLGHAQQVAQDRDRAASTLNQAAEIARAHSDGVRLARAVTGVAWARHRMGQAVGASVALLEEVLEALGDQDCAERAEALSALGMQFYLGHTYPRARELTDEAVAVARGLDSPRTLSSALGCQLLAHIGFDDIDERRATGMEMLRLAEESEDPVAEAYALGQLIWCVFERGDRVEFERLLREAERNSSRTQDRTAFYYYQLEAAALAILDAQWTEAENLARAALDIGQRVLGENAVQFFGIQMLSILSGRGRLEEAVALAEAGTQQQPHPAWRCALAWLCSESGRTQEARAIFDEVCADDFAAIPRDEIWPTALAALTLTCCALGDKAQAEKLHALLAPHPRRIIRLGVTCAMWGATSYHLGRLATMLGRLDEAAAHFEDALGITARIGSRYWLADTRCAYAELFSERNASGDREHAIELANRALDAARRYEMEHLVKKALAVKLELQGLDSNEIKGSIHAVGAAVQERQPDLRMHTAPDGTVTLMFSDMEGFTAMTERVGDLKARDVIRTHNAIVREQLKKHGGYEVELRGDGFLLAFGSARQALLCAIETQRAFAARNQQDPEEPIRVRIGLHTGEVLKDADTFFGKTVILAARVAAQAEGGEILVSSLLKELTESVGDIRFGKAREVALKGISETQRLFTVEWQQL